MLFYDDVYFSADQSLWSTPRWLSMGEMHIKIYELQLVERSRSAVVRRAPATRRERDEILGTQLVALQIVTR